MRLTREEGTLRSERSLLLGRLIQLLAYVHLDALGP
jgi:hypothetical protein